MVYVHYDYGATCAKFLVAHKDEHIKCLSEFFDVVTVSESSEIGHLCDLHAPDILAFELGLQIARARRPAIRNIGVALSIPRIGILNADAWGGTRGQMLSDIALLRLDAVFSICTTAVEHLAAIADKVFFWPNFIDPDIFYASAAEKLVALTISGCRDQNYPWRRAVYPMLERRYPSIVCPHHGYLSGVRPNQTLMGRDYAKLIAAAWIAPTCGTVAMDLVRKHLEIPACGTLLLTERSAALEAAGFRDLENCLFAAPEDVIDKVGLIFEQPDKLTRMIARGRKLVLERHTYRQRDQIRQWYELSKIRKPGEVIAQIAPFSKLTLRMERDAPLTQFRGSDGMHLQLIRKGNEQYTLGRFEAAAELYLQSLQLVHTMAEPRLMLAACDLRSGRVEDAHKKLVSLLRDTLGKYEDMTPDPVEWAYLVACYLCLGDLRSARKRAAQYPAMNHSLIIALRRALGIGPGPARGATSGECGAIESSLSVHTFLVQSFVQWQPELHSLMASCGQSHLYSSLFDATLPSTRSGRRLQRHRSAPRARGLSGLMALFKLQPKTPLRGFDNPFVFERLRSRLVSSLENVWARARQAAKAGRLRQGRN